MRYNQYMDILKLQLTWIAAADKKVIPLLTINLAMLGAVSIIFRIQNGAIEGFSYSALISAILLTVSCISIALVIFPRLGGPKDSDIYFGSIASVSSNQFLDRKKAEDEEKLLDDILSQVHRNAQIAHRKHANLQFAYLLLFLSLPFWLFSIIS